MTDEVEIEEVILPVEPVIPPEPTVGAPVATPVVLQARHPKYNRVGTIDCEVHHEQYGWIPFTANPNDDLNHGRELYAQFLRGDYGSIADCPGLTLEQQKAKIAEQRYMVETSGIVINGMDINTERSSQGLILGAALEAFMDPTYELNWKTPTGFVPLTAPVVLFIAKAIRAHVQACFNREAELVTALEAGTYNETMLHLGWPT